MATKVDEVPAHLVVDYDLHDPALASTMLETLAEIHAIGPVTYSTAHGGHWLVTGYSEARHVLTHPEVFSSFPNSLPRHPTLPKTIPLEVDPPEHGVYRDVISPLFAPTRMRALEDSIRGLATRLIDGFVTRGTCEFVSAFAHPLPSGMFLAVMGWPLDDLGRFVDWTEAIINPTPGLSDEERLQLRVEAVEQYTEYFQTIIDEVRAHPDDSFTSAIVSTEIEGGRTMTDAELVNMFGLLMIAGLHTVRGVLGHTMIALSARADVRRAVIADPQLIPDLVEEMLRLQAPASPGRTVRQATELSGVSMQPGDRLLVAVPIVNYDAAEFDEPGALRLDRETNRHLAFAAGPHRCVGSHLARLELRVALEELLRRIPDFEVVGTPKLHHGQVRGVAEITLRFTPERPDSGRDLQQLG